MSAWARVHAEVTGPAANLVELLEAGPVERRLALETRISRLLDALGAPRDDSRPGSLAKALGSVVGRAQPSEAWLTAAVVTGRLPTVAQVQRLVRAGRLGNGIEELLSLFRECPDFGAGRWPDVEIITEKVVVDLHHTARSLFATGIQRVAREATRRWSRDHDVVLTGWTAEYEAYRRLTASESADALEGRKATAPPAAALSRELDVVVPWKCTHIVPELPAEPERALRYHGFAAFSGSTTGLIGYDCVPVVAAETCAEGMSAAFSMFLAAAAHVDRIATISVSSALEFRGWQKMLTGSGRQGPEIVPIPLGVNAPTPTEAAQSEARRLVCIDSLPVVLTVGSHEPRKNHLAVLHAAELLWRDNVRFTLTFVGGNSWNSAEFAMRVAELQAINRPVQVIRALSDDLLWAAYRVAHCTVFPSLHEGFGLPVAESLASGTPVITSNFGSMSENAANGAALLVDPRDDHQLAEALRQLLVDARLHQRLAAEAAALSMRSWDDFAAETWEYFVNGGPPGAGAASMDSVTTTPAPG